jgi:predicted DNA-binding transcriptional regulator YafY
MPSDVRDRIDQMKNRFDFISPTRQAKTPYLSILLESAVQVDFDIVQCIVLLVMIFALFRCDKMYLVEFDEKVEPKDLTDIHLGNRQAIQQATQKTVPIYVELSREGVRRCEGDLGRRFTVHVREDGTGWIEDQIRQSNIPYFANYFIRLGEDAKVKHSSELIADIKQRLVSLMDRYC